MLLLRASRLENTEKRKALDVSLEVIKLNTNHANDVQSTHLEGEDDNVLVR